MLLMLCITSRYLSAVHTHKLLKAGMLLVSSGHITNEMIVDMQFTI
jgi:hypothetical protein